MTEYHNINDLLLNTDFRDRSTMNEIMREALSQCKTDWEATLIYYYIKSKYEQE